MKDTFKISRFEEQGESLFICINSTNNPVYIEHFFTEEEKLDKAGTIEKLVAELEIKDSEYVAPLPRISKLEEVELLEIKPANILSCKNAIIAEKVEAEAIKLAEEKEASDKLVLEMSEELTDNNIIEE